MINHQTTTESVLERIFADKKNHFIDHGPSQPKQKLAKASQTIIRPLQKRAKNMLIAEIKRGSPSRGPINRHLDVVDVAMLYEQAGASAISVLTEEKYFHGHLEYLARIASISSIPLLRKDFIFCPEQIRESKLWGADGVLLISSYLDLPQIKILIDAAHKERLWVLLEAHSYQDLKQISFLDNLYPGIDYIGINNRNLHNLKLDPSHGLTLLKQLALDGFKLPCSVIAESGFNNAQQIRSYTDCVAGFLVGSSLMEKPSLPDIAQVLSELINA